MCWRAHIESSWELPETTSSHTAQATTRRKKMPNDCDRSAARVQFRVLNKRSKYASARCWIYVATWNNNKQKKSSDFYLHHILQCILLGLHMRTRLAHTHTRIPFATPSHPCHARLCWVVGVWWRTKDMGTNETQTNKNNNTFNYRSSGERRVVKWRTHTQLSLNIHLAVDAVVQQFFRVCSFFSFSHMHAVYLRLDTIGVSFFRECCASNAESLLYHRRFEKRLSNSVTVIIIISIRN